MRWESPVTAEGRAGSARWGDLAESSTPERCSWNTYLSRSSFRIFFGLRSPLRVGAPPGHGAGNLVSVLGLSAPSLIPCSEVG